MGLKKVAILEEITHVWHNRPAELQYARDIIRYLCDLPGTKHKIGMGTLLSFAHDNSSDIGLNVINYLCGSIDVLNLVFVYNEKRQTDVRTKSFVMQHELTKEQMRAVRDHKINPVSGDVDPYVNSQITVCLRLTAKAATAFYDEPLPDGQPMQQVTFGKYVPYDKSSRINKD